MKNDSRLLYLCGLIEHIGRTRRQRRGYVAQQLGDTLMHRIYEYSDVLHSDSIDQVADEYCGIADIGTGDFDNVALCRKTPPERWAIAGVYARLIEDVSAESADPVETARQVYASWVSDEISDYNSDFFYQPRSYIAACYESGEQLA